MDRPFLQTPEWLEFQRYTGHKVWRLDDGFIKANIIRYDVRLGQNFLSIPYGPELNMDLAEDGIKNQVTDFIKTIAHIGQEEKSMFVKIEPMHDMVTELLYRNGMKLRRSPVDLQPHATVVADLSQTEDELLDDYQKQDTEEIQTEVTNKKDFLPNKKTYIVNIVIMIIFLFE